MPEDLRQIQWTEYGQTVLHPLAVGLLLVMLIWVMTGDNRRSLIPLLIVGAFITSLQRLVIGSFDFTMLRLLLLGFGARAVLRNDTDRPEWTAMDTLFVFYVLALSIVYVALWRTPAAVTNRLGFAFDASLAFFVLRFYLRNLGQLTVLMRGFCVVLFVVAVAMLVEQLTQYNVFSIFGGVSPVTGMREGRLRAQGAFSHPILAGTFAGVFLPLAWALGSTGQVSDKWLSRLGVAGAAFMVYASSSSGPVVSLLAALLGVLMWRYRRHTRQFVRLGILGLIALHFYMNAPVWHLISRMDFVGGSTGWHRFALLDRTISNFTEWALLGVHTTGHWGWGLNDVTNMFVLQAVRGGFITLLLFVLVIAKGFRFAWDSAEQAQSEFHRRMSWAWGVVLFAHCVSFFGISYFGSMTFFWYLTLGVLATLPRLVIREPRTSDAAQ